MKSNSQTAVRTIHVNQLQQLHFYLDVLTDGSEHTGWGATFLTVARGSKSRQNDVEPSITDETILARYALTGLPTLTSRLAADQAFKLSSVRAVFCPLHDVATTAGIPSLLLSLSNYSMTGQLNVIGPKGIGYYMDEIVGLILGRRKMYPAVLNCEIPSRYDGTNSAPNDCWWKVYSDEYIFVHARMYSIKNSDSNVDTETENVDANTALSSKVVYIFTIKAHDQLSHSFGVVPPSIAFHPTTDIFQPLPQDIIQEKSSKSDKGKIFDFIFHICPFYVEKSNCLMKVSQEITNLCDRHFATVPHHDTMDKDILVRATYQSRILNARIPFAFARSKEVRPNVCAVETDSKSDHNGNDNECIVSYTRLSSCSSVWLGCLSSFSENTQATIVVSRRDEILDKIETIDFNKSWTSEGIDELERYYSQGDLSRKAQQNIDENEIDLSDESEQNDEACHTNDNNEILLSDDDDDSDPETETPSIKRRKVKDTSADERPCSINMNRPMLIVLGTGCASPSPLRGSSGYALMLPTKVFCNHKRVYRDHISLSALIDCGEGVLLTLFRNLPQKSNDLSVLESLRFIWISHTHLDHYGELPMVIALLSKRRKIFQMCSCYDRFLYQFQQLGNACDSNEDQYPRCKKCGQILPLIVIAPPKVLHFLDVSTNCKNGVLNLDCNRKVRLFFGVSNKDFDHSPFARQLREDLFQYELRRQVPKAFKLSSYDQSTSRVSYTYNPLAFFKSVPVEHCPNAYALLISLRVPNCKESDLADSFFTLCYSGDTRPSQNMVRVCQQACKQSVEGNRFISLLLHEATFDDDERGRKEAIAKKHSTVEEAIRIAKQIQARACLLTHFSQRYPKLPPGYKSATAEKEKSSSEKRNSVIYDSSSSDFAKLKIGNAVDGMLIPLDDDNLPSVLPILSLETLKVMSEIHSPVK